MKAQEFYTELRKILQRGYYVSRTSKQGTRSEIRLARKDSHKSFCPLTAVCHALTGKYVPVDDACYKVPKLLKMHSDTVDTLIAAADADGSPIVRKRLQQVLGL